MRQSLFIRKVENATSTGVATVTIPRNTTVYGVRLIDANNIGIAKVTKVEVVKSKNDDVAKGAGHGRGGESVLWSVTGTQLNEMNKIDNIQDYAASAGTLKLIFEDNKLKLPGGQYASAINVKSDETLRVEVTTITTNPSWSAYVDINDVLSNNIYCRRLRAYTAVMAGGEATTSAIPYGDAERKYWRRLMIAAGAGTITNTRITLGAGNTEFYNRLTSLNLAILGDLGYTVGTYYGEIIDFAETGVLEVPDLSHYATGDQNVSILTTNATPATNTYVLEAMGVQ